MKRTSFQDMPCPIARTLDVLGERWALLVVREAFKGARRFKEFEERLGVAPNILTTRLKSLVEADILAIESRDQGGRAQAYVLTEAGRALLPTLVTLSIWGLRHCFDEGEAGLQIVDRETGVPLTGVCFVGEDGSVVPVDRVQFRPR